jgi:large subunit ribosomal protein L22
MEDTFEARAILRRVRLSPRKARLVADLIRGDNYIVAHEKLRFSTLKAAKIIKKLIDSAYSNAEVKAERTEYSLNIEDLYVKTIFVDEGPKLRRFRPRARGMAYRINKKTSHITVVLESR